jgi:drug/metabolite transporter (DMT)-like permease
MLTANCIFGGYNVVAKQALDEGTQPLIFCLYRDLPASIILLTLAAATGSLRRPHDRRDGWLMVATGLSGVFVGQVFFIFGLNLTSSNLASIFQPLSPPFTVAIGVVSGIERPTRFKSLGIALACAGAAVIVAVDSTAAAAGPGGAGGGTAGGGAGGGAGGTRLAGVIFLLLNTMGASAYFCIQKPLLEATDPTGAATGDSDTGSSSSTGAGAGSTDAGAGSTDAGADADADAGAGAGAGAGALRRRRRYSPLMVTAAGYSAGTVFVLFSAMYYVHSPGSWQLSRSSLYVVAYAVLCVSCLRYSHYVQTPQTPPPRLRSRVPDH